jgi:hypothetical protein
VRRAEETGLIHSIGGACDIPACRRALSLSVGWNVEEDLI